MRIYWSTARQWDRSIRDPEHCGQKSAQKISPLARFSSKVFNSTLWWFALISIAWVMAKRLGREIEEHINQQCLDAQGEAMDVSVLPYRVSSHFKQTPPWLVSVGSGLKPWSFPVEQDVAEVNATCLENQAETGCRPRESSITRFLLISGTV